tara:strand:- start:523 stop:939 length:417 start_codon:yes stop_codon:yes gene_type:complete
MERWMMYGLVAAIFIALRDVFSIDLINRYDYTDYIIVASALLFLGSLIYLFVSKKKVKVPDSKDFLTIVARLLVVYMIIEPCIFYSIKHCENPGYAKSIINLNTLFVFILAVVFLNQKIDKKKLLGILLIFGGAYYLK